MLPVHSSLANEFDQILSAAVAVGLGEESERIARRAAGLQQPFMLFVMGEKGSGKSTVINQLARADVAPVGGTPESWLNVYRRRTGDADFAEVFWKSNPGRIDVLPVEQARSFTRQSVAFEFGSTFGIDRVVWHVNASGIHRDLAIVEVPDEARVVASTCWEADAVLWVTSADEAATASPASSSLEAFRRERSPFVSTLCAVTHMDRVPRTQWIGRLRTVRAGRASAFDHVVPFGVETDVQGRALSVTITPLQRSIASWISADAEKSRRKNHRHFIDAMRRLVCRRVEEEIDALLQSGADFRRFEEHADARIAEEAAFLADQTERYLGLLSDAATAYGERLERSFHAYETGAFIPPIAGAVFFDRLREDLQSLAREIGGSWQPSEAGDRDEPATRLRLVAHPAFPAPPVTALNDFVVATQTDANLVEAERFDEAHDVLSGRVPTEAALYMPARLAAARRAETVRASVSEWLKQASVSVKDAAVHTARAAFADRFGCTLEEVPARLRDLESHYMKLMREDVCIPSRGDGALTSPARFLWEARQPEFISRWNALLARDFVDQVLPDVARRVQHELDLHRDEQERAWQGCRRNLAASLEGAMTGRSSREVRSNPTGWPLDWAVGLLPDRLRQPLTRPTTGLVVDDASAETLSMFLSDHASFLLPRKACASGSPGRAAVRLFQDAVRDEAARIWGEPVALPTPAHVVRLRPWKSMIGIIVAAALTMGWTAATDGGIVALSAVGGFLAVGLALLWRRETSRTRLRLRRECARLSTEIHENVLRLIDERNEHLQRYTRLLIRDESFLRDAEQAILQLVTTAAPAIPSYGDLIRRLRGLPAAANAA